MSESTMPADLRQHFLDVAVTIEPRASSSAEIEHPDPLWQGKYADVAHAYYNGFVEDVAEAGLPRRAFSGVLLGYRVYGAALAQAPHALHALDPAAPKDNLALYDALTNSLEASLGPVAGVPSHVNAELEKRLHLRSLPVHPDQVGFEFYRSPDGIRYRAKPDIIESVPVDIDEEVLAIQGIDYQTALAKKCVMPWEFHQRVWGAMVGTCVFNYQYINADLDALKSVGVAEATT